MTTRPHSISSKPEDAKDDDTPLSYLCKVVEAVLKCPTCLGSGIGNPEMSYHRNDLSAALRWASAEPEAVTEPPMPYLYVQDSQALRGRCETCDAYIHELHLPSCYHVYRFYVSMSQCFHGGGCTHCSMPQGTLHIPSCPDIRAR